MEVENINIENEDNYGPLELNLLERVEEGFNQSDKDSLSKNNITDDEENNNKKYSGPKEIIFVSGWANINSIYKKYIVGFILKIFIAIALIFSLKYYDQNFLPIFAIFSIFTFFYVSYYLYMIQIHKNSNFKIRQILYIDLAIMIGYCSIFTAFVLVFTKILNPIYLPVFVIPHFITAIFLSFYTPEDHLYVASKRLLVFETIKFSNPTFLTWYYVLFYFMCIAIYLIVLGLLMSIILSCSLFGFLYRDIESWKVKSLIWMTWYYLWNGIVFTYLIKGVVIFYEELDLIPINVTFENYLGFKSFHADVLYVAAVLLLIASLIGLFFHLLWKKDIKKYLSKVIYKNELRKEISLRFLDKNFNFKLIQVSSTYFMKSDRAIQKRAEDNKKDEEVVATEKEISKEQISIEDDSTTDKRSKFENELCVFCYEKSPNILIDPCCHGGVCKECIISYLKVDGVKCPFCKCTIQKLFLINFDKEKKQLFATGEINLKVQLRI